MDTKWSNISANELHPLTLLDILHDDTDIQVQCHNVYA